jgi:hypothetical protein
MEKGLAAGKKEFLYPGPDPCLEFLFKSFKCEKTECSDTRTAVVETVRASEIAQGPCYLKPEVIEMNQLDARRLHAPSSPASASRD